MSANAASKITVVDLTDQDVSSWADLRTDPEERGENISVNGTGADLAGYFSVADPGLSKPLSTNDFVATGLSVAGAVGTVATFFIPGLQPVAPLAVALTALTFAGEISTLYQDHADISAFNDPYDPNYKTVFQPTPVTLPAVDLTSLPATLATSAGAYLMDAGGADSLANAVYVTQNRMLSAAQDGDAASWILQNNALNTVVAQLGAADTTLANDAAKLSADLKLAGVTGTLTQQQITGFINNVKTQGLAALPQTEQDFIKQNYPSTTDQQAVLAQITAVDPVQVPSDIVSAFAQQSSALLSMGQIYSNTSWGSITTPTSGNFSIVDTTTGQTSTSDGTPYNGPVAGLTSEYINITTDSLNVTSKIPNVFLHTGSGVDALNVTQANGNNVLDGGTNSNFLDGGAGNDTFYLDDRNANAAIWSTIANFHSGDSATIWGLVPTSNLTTLDGQGAPGFTGLTLTSNQHGQPAATLTIAGYTTADLSNGRLTMSYGRTSDLPNLPGSNYLAIHAT
jgi:hypothetical protein